MSFPCPPYHNLQDYEDPSGLQFVFLSSNNRWNLCGWNRTLSPPVISPAPPSGLSGHVGASFTYNFTVTGYPNPTITVTGLPPGVTFSQSGRSGRISGTPATGSDASSPYTVTITATNSEGTDTQSIQFAVTATGPGPAHGPAYYGNILVSGAAGVPTETSILALPSATPPMVGGTVANPAVGTVMTVALPDGAWGYVFAYPASVKATPPAQIWDNNMSANVLSIYTHVSETINGEAYHVYYLVLPMPGVLGAGATNVMTI